MRMLERVALKHTKRDIPVVIVNGDDVNVRAAGAEEIVLNASRTRSSTSENELIAVSNVVADLKVILT